MQRVPISTSAKRGQMRPHLPTNGLSIVGEGHSTSEGLLALRWEHFRTSVDGKTKTRRFAVGYFRGLLILERGRKDYSGIGSSFIYVMNIIMNWYGGFVAELCLLQFEKVEKWRERKKNEWPHLGWIMTPMCHYSFNPIYSLFAETFFY